MWPPSSTARDSADVPARMSNGWSDPVSVDLDVGRTHTEEAGAPSALTDGLERPVVAGPHDRPEDRRVERTAGEPPRIDRQLDEGDGLRRDPHRLAGVAVEPADLAV